MTKYSRKREPKGVFWAKVYLVVAITFGISAIGGAIMALMDGYTDGISGQMATIPAMLGIPCALVLLNYGRKVAPIYGKWRIYGILSIVVFVLGIVIGAGFGMSAAGIIGVAINVATALLLGIYGVKYQVRKRYVIAYNELVDKGWFDEQDRKKAAAAQRSVDSMREMASDAADRVSEKPMGVKIQRGQKIERPAPATPASKPVTPQQPVPEKFTPEPVAPKQPEMNAQEEQTANEGMNGHKLKL